MGKTDGKVVLSTKLDNSGVEKGSKELKNALSDTTSALKRLAGSLAAAFSVSALIGFSKESSAVATQTEANVQRLIDIYGDASDKIGDFIDANARAMGMSKSAAAGFAAVYGNLFSVWADQQQNALLTTEYLNMTAVVASKTGRTVADVQERVRSGLLGNTEAIEDLGIFVNIKTIEITESFQKIANGRNWDQLNTYEQQQVRTLAILEQSTKKYGTEVANNAALTKAQYQAAFADFQSTWGQVVNTVLLPVLRVLTQIFNVAIAGLQVIFGISNRIIGNTEKTGEKIKQEVEKQKEFTEEVKATGKALKKTTAGFDELQKLNDNSGGSGISGLGSIIDLSQYEIGEMGNFDISGIDANLAAIMMAIGEALAAVGVILIFSGQLAWGIGFVIAGATIFGVSMAAVTGDTVSPSVIATLTTLMGVLAGVLVAIGIILVMSGSTAMGIGFIVAGAADLGATAATLVQFSSDPIIDTILMIEAAAGAALLTLGILMLYFGHKKPLAIALIAAGAATLVTSVAQIVAGAVSDEVAAWIYGITAIVSVALLAIGIIMLATGHITPLSIGLLIAGAAGLATTAAINWNSIVDALRGRIGVITATVSAALLVLGIVLLFVPGAQGLGLGLLIAGAAGLATVFAFNWDSILNSIKDAWNGIKNYWNQNIAHVFTKAFWLDLAKKCGNGMIDGFEGAINGIISMFESMINWVVDGLNRISISVPDWVPEIGGSKFGFNLQRVSLNRVSIPCLAKGAVIPPNREFLAVLGDQKRGTNIEAPLSTIQEAVAKVMLEQTSATMAAAEAIIARQEKILAAIEAIEIGDSTIGEAALRYNRKMAVVRGG